MSPRTSFLAVTVRAPQAQVEALESVKERPGPHPKMGALTVAASDDAGSHRGRCRVLRAQARLLRRKG